MWRSILQEYATRSVFCPPRQRLAGERFPLGTLTVNLLGCLAFGIAWGLLAERAGFSTQTKIVLLVGFLGAFTTFSTYAYETLALLQSGQILAAVLNVGLQTVLGLGCVLLGLAAAQAL